MVHPADIQIAAHELCVAELIPNMVSQPHGIERHEASGPLYADPINLAGGLEDVTGQQVVDAIIAVVGWDKRSPWPGHPRPELVIDWLRENG